MNPRFFLSAAAALLCTLPALPADASAAAAAPADGLQTATGHPMAYHLSLPKGWQPGRRWPVVVILESANREFAKTAGLFAAARGDRPFILLTPLIISGGGPRYREAPDYRYDAAAWARIERDGPFKFDAEGIAAMLADARRRYGAQDKYFLTGWEAGAHTLFALLFRHPEALRGAVAVTPNYLGRHLGAADFSADPARVRLPVRILVAGQIADDPAGRFIVAQARDALAVARARGYGDVTLATLPGHEHTPMAGEVLDYFAAVAGRDAEPPR